MLADKPLLSKYDTVSYTDLQKDGSFERFTHQMGVKSFITNPSPGLALQQPGWYEIKGLAWSGAGGVKQVDISADGGKTWAQAALDPAPARLMSRATDAADTVQPNRADLLAQKGRNSYYHYNGMTTWAVSEGGAIRHVY